MFELNARRNFFVISFLVFSVASIATAQQAINVSQGIDYASLQDALSNATNGNIIQLYPGVYQEDDISIPVGVNVTVRGSGMGVTIIDGSNGSNTRGVFELNDSGQTTATVIQDLTIQNDVRGFNFGATGGAVFLRGNVSLTLRRVEFVGNTAPAGAGGARAVHVVNGAKVRLESCQILDNDGANGTAIIANGSGSDAYMLNTLVQHEAEPLSVVSDANMTAINSTLVGQVHVGSTGHFAGVNCVMTDSAAVDAGGSTGILQSVFPGATSGNIDGAPTFVNAAARDYLLAAGSLGIDMANMFSYESAFGPYVDANGEDRFVNDTNASDSGFGPLAFLDAGAFEYQAEPAPTSEFCPGDMNGDGAINGLDTQMFVQALILGATCP